MSAIASPARRTSSRRSPDGRLRRGTRLAVAGLTLALAGTLAGCGSGEGDSPAGGTPTGSPAGDPTPSVSPTASSSTSKAPSPAPTSSGTTVEIVITQHSVKPDGKRLEVAAGEPIVLRITAADAGELHVHSSPEQQVVFPAGTSEHSIVLEQPGVVDLEEHHLRKVIVQLEVR